jgi:hypothetical protein
VDGQQQRKALSAAERAIEHLGRGDAAAARRAADTAASLDQIGAFGGLRAAVETAAGLLDAGGALDDAAWDGVADAVGPGPLAAAVDAHR